MLTLPRFDWVRPRTFDALLGHLGDHAADSLLLAGGTDAVPNLKHRLHEPRYVVAIGGIAELHFIRHEADGLHLGPLVTLDTIATEPRIRAEFPSLARAASLVAGPQLRNMGTLGGNLCLDTRCTYYNQTFFWRESLGFCLKKSGTVCHVITQGKRCVAAHSSDTAPVLISLGAEVEIANRAGSKVVSVEDFFVPDGVHNNILEPGDVVTRIFIPAASRGMKAGYQKLRPRASIDFPMLSVAFAATLNGTAESGRLVVSAIAAKPRTINGVDDIVRGKALDMETATALGELAFKQCQPLINVAYDQAYRRSMVPVFVRRAVLEAAAT